MADSRLSPGEVADARKRRLEAEALQRIEANPLAADEVAMFEMFERERWSHARRREFILAKVRQHAAE
jgi:hypothetical protein